MQRLGFRTKHEIDAGNVETPALVMKCRHLPKGCRPSTLRDGRLTPFWKLWAPKLEGPGMLVCLVYQSTFLVANYSTQYTFTHIMPHKFSDIKDYFVPDAVET